MNIFEYAIALAGFYGVFCFFFAELLHDKLGIRMWGWHSE